MLLGSFTHPEILTDAADHQRYLDYGNVSGGTGVGDAGVGDAGVGVAEQRAAGSSPETCGSPVAHRLDPSGAELIHEFSPEITLVLQRPAEYIVGTLLLMIEGKRIAWFEWSDPSLDPLFPLDERQAELDHLERQVGLRSFDLAGVLGFTKFHPRAVGLTMGLSELKHQPDLVDRPHLFILEPEVTGRHSIEATFDFPHSVQVQYSRSEIIHNARHVAVSIDGQLALVSCMHFIR